MPFVYKFSYSYQGLKEFLDSPTGQAYFDAFKPSKQLILYEKGKRNKPPIYLVTDIDLFPPPNTHPIVKMKFTALDQAGFNKLCFNLSLYVTEGDLSLLGGDELNGESPIFGNPN